MNDMENFVKGMSLDDLQKIRDLAIEEMLRRDKEAKLEAGRRLEEALRDYLAKGYTLYVKGEIENDFHNYADYLTAFGEVNDIKNENGSITLKFEESY